MIFFFVWLSSLESSGIDSILYPRIGTILCSEISGIGSIPISALESSGSGYFFLAIILHRVIGYLLPRVRRHHPALRADC